MSAARSEQALFVLRQSQLAYDVTAFIVDRQARGLAPNTIRFYTIELHRAHRAAKAFVRWIGRHGDETARFDCSPISGILPQ